MLSRRRGILSVLIRQLTRERERRWGRSTRCWPKTCRADWSADGVSEWAHVFDERLMLNGDASHLTHLH